MKKLMIAASAALCATVGFSDVTSANIVGYSSVKTDGDWGTKFVSAQFGNCGNLKKFKLADIKPNANGSEILTEADLIGTISFQLIDNAGYTVDGSSRTWDGAKWVDGVGQDMSDEAYDVATGLCVANFAYNEAKDWSTDAVNFQSAGQVLEEDVIATLDTDFGTKPIANPYPTALKLKDIIPYTADKNWDDTPVELMGAISFQYLDNAGYTVDGSSRTWDGTKWVDGIGQDMSEEVIAPGDGVVFANGAMRVMAEDWSEILCANVTVRLVAPKIQ